MYFMVHLYWTHRFLHSINLFDIKINKLRLNETHVTKLNSN